MAEHDDRDLGYFLPEDSQLLLTQIKNHIRFLARLAQPRIADGVKEGAPTVGMAELMFCMDQLAEQLELVLKDVTWLEQLGKSQEVAAESLQAASSEVEDDREGAVDDQRLSFGVTVDQIDRLHLLVAGIKALGDSVHGDASADFAAGTVSVLGSSIFDRAVEVDEILAEIAEQSLAESPAHSRSVRESRPAYGENSICPDMASIYRFRPMTPARLLRQSDRMAA